MDINNLEPADKIRHYFARNDSMAIYDVFMTSYIENTKSINYPCGHVLDEISKEKVREIIYGASEPESILEELLALIEIYRNFHPN